MACRKRQACVTTDGADPAALTDGHFSEPHDLRLHATEGECWCEPRGPASLTDEDLAELMEWIERYDGDIAGAVAPVIAALRASRAEVERSWRTINGVEAELTRAGIAITYPLSDAVAELVAERVAARAEVERLRAQDVARDAKVEQLIDINQDYAGRICELQTETERLQSALAAAEQYGETADAAALALLAEVAERAGHPDMAARLDAAVCDRNHLRPAAASTEAD